MLCLLNSPFSPARQFLSWQQRSEPRFRFVLGWNQIVKPLKTPAGIRPLVITEWAGVKKKKMPYIHLKFEITCGCLIYLQDWPRHGCAEPLRAIQRKREAGFLQSHKEEKEKIPNGNWSGSCQSGMDVLLHAYCTVCPLCILNLLLPNFLPHVQKYEVILCVCPVSCLPAMNHGPLYCRCRSLKEGLLPPRNLFSLCLAQRIA